jgi:transcriptional regulator with XRE-family HTH domain
VTDFRTYLTNRRKSLGLSQAEVADRMGTTQSGLSELETSAAPNPTLKTLAAWTDALDVKFSVQFTIPATSSFAIEPERAS